VIERHRKFRLGCVAM